MANRVDWKFAIQPLLDKYRGQDHPLQYGNTYQLLVMVILSAQDNDKNINRVAPELFEAFPDIATLSKAEPEDLFPFVRRVRNFANKAKWLVEMARAVKDDENIPLTHAGLTALKGIGSKSANVILHETGQPAEGVIVDLHVVRVANRLGIANGTDRRQLEEQIKKKLLPGTWDAGMAMTLLGREVCRPKPICEACVMTTSCRHYQQLKKKAAR